MFQLLVASTLSTNERAAVVESYRVTHVGGGWIVLPLVCRHEKVVDHRSKVKAAFTLDIMIREQDSTGVEEWAAINAPPEPSSSYSSRSLAPKQSSTCTWAVEPTVHSLAKR